MPELKNETRLFRSGIVYIPADEIYPNPVQPRKRFHQESLEELASSISQYGVLNPLTVRPRGGVYELVAGERRLRASKLAGLCEVPCIVLDVDIEESTLLALIENIQRRDLDFVEEAEGINRLRELFGMSQEEAARKLGMSQSAVANKLRLLKLPPDVLDTLRAENLTERHGRALLRLQTPEEQRAALGVMVKERMNVSTAEEFIDSLLASPPLPEKSAGRKRLFVLKDVRVFLNTLTHGLDIMKQGGIDADMKRSETDSELILTISIPKQK